MRIKFSYDVTDEVIRREMVETGRPLGRRRAVVFELTELSPSARQHITALFPMESPDGVTPALLGYWAEPRNEIEITLGTFKARADYKGDGCLIVERKALGVAVPTIAECESALADLAASKPTADAAVAKLHMAYEARETEQKAKRQAEEAEYERFRQAERERKKEEEARRHKLEAQAEAERAAWIDQHGSEHLKRACAAGYSCQRKYVAERAALEWPGWEVDFDNVAEWRERVCPSIKALDIEEGAKRKVDSADVEIVWLTHPAHKVEEDDYFGGEWQAREAVVVRNYLGKYDLVREVQKAE